MLAVFGGKDSSEGDRCPTTSKLKGQVGEGTENIRVAEKWNNERQAS